MNQVSVLTAFFAGVVSFLSPCVLPLIPGYISFISGLSLEELSKGGEQRSARRKAGLGSIAFVMGFSVVFTLLGASASVIGQFLVDHIVTLSRIAGVIIILFGLHTIGILPIKWLYMEKRFQTTNVAPGLVGAFVMGLAFAFGWTPCIGPILAAILAFAATQETVAQGIFLLFVYSMGLGIPFIITGFALNAFLKFFQHYKRFIRWGEVAAGMLLIFVGVLMFSNKLTGLIGFVPDFFFRFAHCLGSTLFDWRDYDAWRQSEYQGTTFGKNWI